MASLVNVLMSHGQTREYESLRFYKYGTLVRLSKFYGSK